MTFLLTEQHLREKIDDHLLAENEIGDWVQVARITQNRWMLAWYFRTGPCTRVKG